MNFGSQPAPAWPTTVAFANLYDATTYGRTVYMTNRRSGASAPSSPRSGTTASPT